ncbi:hypothetical protein CK203_110571 [Vitis vinifera]|uniref:Ubiquitin-like protease family profile domain-containing protein n=1 Tax=Vitis vinifera TaxID=29760 RepID=A0A438CFI7_VITVI|nr:hypothetical protein CK203_110571 [Vitis vinifera]
MEKKNVTMDMRFEGLLEFGCKELRYELIMWIVVNYDIGYHCLCRLYNQKNQLCIMMHLYTRPQAHIPMTPSRSSGGQSGCALTPLDETVVERNKEETRIDVHPCSDQVMGKGTGAARTHSGQQRGTTATVDDGPFIDQQSCPPLTKGVEFIHLKGHQEMLVVDYALAEDGEPSEILCDMHGAYITWDELSSLNGGRWVNSVLFFSVCNNNHWHVHVLDIPASRFKILSSLPLRRGNGISIVSRRLSEVIDKAFHAHGMLKVCHSAPIEAKAIMHDGTTVETFVRKNLVGFVEILSLPLVEAQASLFQEAKLPGITRAFSSSCQSSICKVEKSLSGAIVSAVVTTNDVSNVGLSKDILSKEALAPKEPSSLNPTLEKSKPPSAPSVQESGFTNLDNVVADSTGAKFNEPSEDEIYKKDQGNLDVKQANCHSSHNSTADKPDSKKTSPKAIVSIISNANGTLEKIEPVKLPNGPSGENLKREKRTTNIVVGTVSECYNSSNSFRLLHLLLSFQKEEQMSWQHGIQEEAADWDKDWDKFEEEGYIFGKELTLDVQNVIAPPTPKSMLVDKEKTSTAETLTVVSSSVDVNSEDPPSMGERVVENGSAYSQIEDYSARSPGNNPLARVAMERSIAGSPAARIAMERSLVGSPAVRATFERSPDGNPAARTAFERSSEGSPATRHAFDSPSRQLLDSHFFKPFCEDASPHAKDTQRY